MNIYKSLSQHAKGIMSTVNIDRLRGVLAALNEKTDTLKISYYFSEEPTEEEIEEASKVSTDIIAALPIAYLDEEFINFESLKPLPESNYWVFRKM